MTFLTRNLRQTATLWTVASVDSSGDPTFNTSKTVKVRWEERTAIFATAAGEEAVASAVIFMAEDVDPGDFLFLGTSIVADPTDVTGSREVQAFHKIPQLKGSGFERRAYLGARK